MIKDTFTLSQDIELYALSFHSDSEMIGDYWNLKVNGECLIYQSHCKDYDEGLYLQVAHPVHAGSEFTFEYYATNGDPRKIHLLFHLLSDSIEEIHLDGNTDLGDYPDPEPDRDNDPYPPGEDGIVLPIEWNLFHNVTEAQEWTKNLGIMSNFNRNLDAANYVTEALAFLFNTCPGFGEMVSKYQLNVNIKNGGGANGYFNPPSNEIVINKNYNFKYASEIAQMEYDTHQKSSPHKFRTIIHEIGHWLHYHNVGETQFNQFAAMDPDAYGDKTMLSKAESDYIANHLCMYATKWYPIELIPEVYTAMVTGVPIDSKISDMYDQYGGYKCTNSR